MRVLTIGLALVGLGGCGPCEERCTKVPVVDSVWPETLGPDLAVATLDAAEGFDAVVALGDYDGDGMGDLATLEGAVIRVFSGAELAAGGAIGPTNALVSIGGGENLVAVGDVDGDGLADLASGRRAAWEVYTLGSGDQPWATITASGDGEITGVAGGGDVDGDGKNDLVVSQRYRGSARTDNKEIITRMSVRSSGAHAVSSGDEGFGAVVDLDRPHSLVVVGDIDGDGLDDVAAGAARNFASVHLSVDWGNGPLGGLGNREVHLHECYPNPDGCNSWVSVAAPGDVDGDGTPDLIVNGVAPDSAWIIPGADLANDTYKTNWVGGQLAIRRQIEGATFVAPAGDLDGVETADGHPLMDLVATDGDTRAWVVLGNQIAGEPAIEVGQAAHALEGFAPAGGILAGTAGDISGDGLDDLWLGDASRIHLLIAGRGEVLGYDKVCEVVDDKKKCR